MRLIARRNSSSLSGNTRACISLCIKFSASSFRSVAEGAEFQPHGSVTLHPRSTCFDVQRHRAYFAPPTRPQSTSPTSPWAEHQCFGAFYQHCSTPERKSIATPTSPLLLATRWPRRPQGVDKGHNNHVQSAFNSRIVSISTLTRWPYQVTT